jgi:hypothetical protein
MTIVGTAEIFDLASKEVNVNHSIEFTQQVNFGTSLFNADWLHTGLFVVVFY